MRLEKLKKQEKVLVEKLEVNRTEQMKIVQAKFVEQYCFDVGSVIEWEDGKKILQGIVTGFNHLSDMSVWTIQAAIVNKGGKQTGKSINIYPSYFSSIKVIK